MTTKLRHSIALSSTKDHGLLPGSSANLQSQLGHNVFRITKICIKSLKTLNQRGVEVTLKAIDEVEMSENEE